MTFTAVGISEEPEKRVVVVFGGSGSMTAELSEAAARKLADDILRNANCLWPIKEDENE
jgi:hypothetical protein